MRQHTTLLPLMLGVCWVFGCASESPDGKSQSPQQPTNSTDSAKTTSDAGVNDKTSASKSDKPNEVKPEDVDQPSVTEKLPELSMESVPKAPRPKQEPDSDEPADDATTAILNNRANPDVGKLLGLLEHRNASVRKGALYGIERIFRREEEVTIADEDAKKIGARLLDQNESVRGAAMMVVRKLAPPSSAVLPFMVTATENEDPDFVERLVTMMGTEYRTVSAPAVPLFAELLTHENVKVRAAAAGALGSIGELAAGAIPNLIKAMNSDRGTVFAPKNSMIIRAAILALGDVGPKAKPAVSDLLEHMKRDVIRKECVRALAQIGNVDPALELLKSPSAFVRSDAYWGLAYARPITPDVWSHFENGLKSTNDSERVAATRALRYVRPSDEKIVELLAPLIADPVSRVRQDVIKTLANLDPKLEAAIPLFEKATEDSDRTVSSDARIALGKFKE